jgi:hypothetical protein
VARAEARRRWPSLLVLGLLVAVVAGASLLALAGARRTASTLDRFREWSGASDVTYQAPEVDVGGAMLAALEDQPAVEAVTIRRLVNAFPDDASELDLAVYSDESGRYGTEIDRPLVLDGRMPDPDEPGEILVNELAADQLGVGVGHRFAARTWTDADLRALVGGQNGFPGFNGPRLDLEVVGIGRFPEELPGDLRRGTAAAIAGPGFLAAYPGIGAWPPALTVRLVDGATAAEAEAVTDAVRDSAVLADSTDETISGTDIGQTTADDAYLDSTQQTINGLTTGLVVFALAVLAAGAIAVGQATTRQLAAASASVTALVELGATRREAARAHAAPAIVAIGAGSVAGAVLAVVASPLLPTGIARRAEIEPGIRIDAQVLGVGTAAIVAALSAFAVRTARRVGEPPRPAATARAHSSWLARSLGRSGAPPSVLTGVRMAGERGPGSVPVRSAAVGAALAVGAVLAAGVVASSYARLTHDPSNWGWVYSAMPDAFGGIPDPRVLADDDRIEAVAMDTSSNLVLDGEAVSSHSLEPVAGNMGYTVLSGRLPVGPAEVALGRGTARDLDVALGDTVTALVPTGGERVLTVVGLVVPPPTEEQALDEGAAVTPEATEQLTPEDDALTSVVLRYVEGTDVARLEADLEEEYGLGFGPFTRAQVPGAVANLAQHRGVAAALAAFFVGLGAIGLFHALVVSTRRRRGELAVLQSLGMQRPEVRRAVRVEALVIVTGALVAGLPLGAIAGRSIWRLLSDELGIVADPAFPWVLLAVTVPVALTAAIVLAWWPAHRAAALAPAQALRTT